MPSKKLSPQRQLKTAAAVRAKQEKRCEKKGKTFDANTRRCVKSLSPQKVSISPTAKKPKTKKLSPKQADKRKAAAAACIAKGGTPETSLKTKRMRCVSPKKPRAKKACVNRKPPMVLRSGKCVKPKLKATSDHEKQLAIAACKARGGNIATGPKGDYCSSGKARKSSKRHTKEECAALQPPKELSPKGRCVKPKGPKGTPGRPRKHPQKTAEQKCSEKLKVLKTVKGKQRCVVPNLRAGGLETLAARKRCRNEGGTVVGKKTATKNTLRCEKPKKLSRASSATEQKKLAKFLSQ